MVENPKETRKRGRPKKPEGVLTSAARQAAYRKKKLDDGVEISLFLTHQQAALLRDVAKKEGKTQSTIVGEMLEKVANILSSRSGPENSESG